MRYAWLGAFSRLWPACFVIAALIGAVWARVAQDVRCPRATCFLIPSDRSITICDFTLDDNFAAAFCSRLEARGVPHIAPDARGWLIGLGLGAQVLYGTPTYRELESPQCLARVLSAIGRVLRIE